MSEKFVELVLSLIIGVWIKYIFDSIKKKYIIIIIVIISTTGGMPAECKRYHSRLVELLATKKGGSYATTMSWIRARVSFALLRSALLCLRGSRAKRRIHLELPDIDFDIEKGHANIHWKHWGRYFISYFLSFFLVDYHIWS